MKNIEITGWVTTGEFDTPKTTNDLLEEAGEKLDSACAWDIVGENLFVGEDGKLYTASVEVVIEEAHQDFAKQVIEDEIDALNPDSLQFKIRGKFLKGLLDAKSTKDVQELMKDCHKTS
jgi:hypothetical protein